MNHTDTVTVFLLLLLTMGNNEAFLSDKHAAYGMKPSTSWLCMLRSMHTPVFSRRAQVVPCPAVLCCAMLWSSGDQDHWCRHLCEPLQGDGGGGAVQGGSSSKEGARVDSLLLSLDLALDLACPLSLLVVTALAAGS